MKKWIHELLGNIFPYSQKTYEILSDPKEKKELLKAIDIERGHLPVSTPCKYKVKEIG